MTTFDIFSKCITFVESIRRLLQQCKTDVRGLFVIRADESVGAVRPTTVRLREGSKLPSKQRLKNQTTKCKVS